VSVEINGRHPGNAKAQTTQAPMAVLFITRAVGIGGSDGFTNGGPDRDEEESDSVVMVRTAIAT
jgi:hypothetical protein